MKEDLIEEIKNLIKTAKEDEVFINTAYLEYFTFEELEEIKDTLQRKKDDFSKINSSYLDEIYEKTKKDKL